jgi:hypothetical protein
MTETIIDGDYLEAVVEAFAESLGAHPSSICAWIHTPGLCKDHLPKIANGRRCPWCKLYGQGTCVPHAENCRGIEGLRRTVDLRKLAKYRMGLRIADPTWVIAQQITFGENR